jgi:hypothetical protein
VPGFHSKRAEPQGAKQMAAPAEPRTPNMHRAKRIAPRECGWKHGDSGQLGGEKNLVQRSQTRIILTPTGLLMEGHSTSLRRLFALFVDDECNRDISPVESLRPVKGIYFVGVLLNRKP